MKAAGGALVKIFQGSGVNPALTAADAVGAAGAAAGTAQSLPSMPLAMATAMADIFGNTWTFCASYMGGLGAFITGSNTVSNMLFGMFQWDIAARLHLPAVIILSAQAAGGAMGNMICVHNIVAVCAVTGLLNREGDIIKKTFWPFLLYGAVVGAVTYILIDIGLFARILN
jgi:lactate permease